MDDLGLLKVGRPAAPGSFSLKALGVMPPIGASAIFSGASSRMLMGEPSWMNRS